MAYRRASREGIAAPSEASFVALFDALNKSKLPYVAIGGIPVVYYGVPRATFDIDLAIPNEPALVEEFLKSMRGLGYTHAADPETDTVIGPLAGITAVEVVRRRNVRLVDAEKVQDRARFPVDLLPIDHGTLLSFKDRESSVSHRGTTLFVPSIDDLIRLKRLSGRPKDISDAEELEKLRKRTSTS